MVINYNNSKEVKCYRDFVMNPDNRSASRAFSKTFGVNLMEPAKKLHDRLKKSESAGAYNSIFGNTENRIEITKGRKQNEPLILKVRVGRGPRKFFNHVIDDKSNLLLTKDWEGDFCSIMTIYVIAVNNHDYNKI